MHEDDDPGPMSPEQRARIEQRAAELDAEGAPLMPDDLIRRLAVLLPLPPRPTPEAAGSGPGTEAAS